MDAKTIAIIGTLDTKGQEFSFLRDRLTSRGLKTLIIDCGVMGPAAFQADVSSTEVAELGGSTLAALQKNQDRGEAIRVMGLGAREKVLELQRASRIQGVISAGGSGNTSIAATAMRDLPIGFPKLILSTVASGDVSPYVGINDITMMYSVGDIEGLNQLTLLVLNNAAGAMAGMVTMDAPEQHPRPTVGLTMFGVTTPAAKAIRKVLEEQGFEVLVFHATGTGGRAMESLIDQGIIQGVIDLTTTEIADEVVGGVLSAGPERLSAGVTRRIPQVIAPGALDMVNFGPKETVPHEFKSRTLYVHNPQVTLMRTTAEENRRFAEFMASKLAHADSALVSICLPLAGVSMIDKKGAVFFDPEANQAFREVLRERLSETLTIVEVDANINDQAFTKEIVSQFLTNWKRHKNQINGG